MNRALATMRRQLSATSHLVAATSSLFQTPCSQKNTLHCKRLLQHYSGFTCSECGFKRSYTTAATPPPPPPPPPGGSSKEKVQAPIKSKENVYGNISAPIGWKALIGLLGVGSGIVWYVRSVREEQEEEQVKRETKGVGKAAIGGPFELVDTKGNTVTEKDFLGKWTLIYFGFCNCPDICPDQLDKLTEVVTEVNAIPHLPNIQPVYITVDPTRDTPEIMDDYLQDFHPDFIGLTGTVEQVKAACKTYRVYYSEGPKDDDDDYIVDHTVISYLLKPNGDFCHYFGQNKGAEETRNEIMLRLSGEV